MAIEDGKMMLIDTSKCIGCKACQVACQQWHSLPAEDTTLYYRTDVDSYQNPADMSGANLTVVKFAEVGAPVDNEPTWFFLKDQCRHCEQVGDLVPACIDACPYDAVKRKKKTGAIWIDDALCQWPDALCESPVAGVPKCSFACPYKTCGPVGIPRFEYEPWSGGSTVVTKAMKCDMCYDRRKHDKLTSKLGNATPQDGPRFKGKFAKSNRPACVLTCPTGAMDWGSAKGIQRKAKKRVLALIAAGFTDAHIYPGGSKPYKASGLTRVIWIIPVDRAKVEFAFLDTCAGAGGSYPWWGCPT